MNMVLELGEQVERELKLLEDVDELGFDGQLCAHEENAVRVWWWLRLLVASVRGSVSVLLLFDFSLRQSRRLNSGDEAFDIVETTVQGVLEKHEIIDKLPVISVLPHPSRTSPKSHC